MEEGSGTVGGEMTTPDAENNQNLSPQTSIPENQQTPEQQEVLAKATKTVLQLYMGDKMSIMLGMQGTEMRDEIWKEATPELGVFANKAKELREAMKITAETKKAYPPTMEAIYKMPFADLKDRIATEYLGDVLFSRMTVSQGYLDYGMDATEQSEIMAQQLGIEAGWRSEQAKEVTLEKAIAATLEGRLRITHQQNVDNEEATRIVTKIEVNKALEKAQQPKSEPKV